MCLYTYILSQSNKSDYFNIVGTDMGTVILRLHIFSSHFAYFLPKHYSSS